VDRGRPQPADSHGGRTPAIARGAAGRRDARTAAVLGLSLFIIFNANGREIPSGDSQAAKFAALMLVRHHTLTLDGLVGRIPQYAERPAFQRDRQGRWRNAYPLPPVLEAAATAAVLRRAGALDLNAPLAAPIVAKVTAAFLASLASVLAFLIARRFCGAGAAVIVALGFGLGTGVWPTVSQTLWQHASVLWSVTAAVWLWTREDAPRPLPEYAALGLLLGWSVSARPQILPMIAVLAAGMLVAAPNSKRLVCAVGFLVPITVFATLNLQWFGHALGTASQLAEASLATHNVPHTWQWPVTGAAGLLVSPSRGLLVFSPIVLVALAAWGSQSHRAIVRWTAAAGVAQFVVYASFSVWWGGHSYGPRYMLDLLPVLVPAAAIGMSRIAQASIPIRALGAAALTWSIVTAATGAFCYPHDQWNTDPVSANVQHARLWEVRDTQILRCWERGWSPQNFALFEREAWRR
jgi:hypothetical protein